MSPKVIAGFILCLAVGVLIGRLLPTADPVPESSPPDQGPPPATVDHDPPASANPASAELPASDTPTSPAPTATEKVLEKGWVALPSALLNDVNLTTAVRSWNQNLFGRDQTIEEHLGITDYEKAVLQTAWSKAQSTIRELEANSARSEDREDGSLLITLPDLSASIPDIGARFRSSAIDTLGEARGGAFVTLKQTDQAFDTAEGERSCTLTPEETGDGTWRFHMVLEGPAGRRVWVGERVPDEIRHLAGDAYIDLEADEAGP